MAMYINTNVPSLTAQRYLGQTNNAVAKSLERLSSGLRINSASDDASGLAISEKLRGQISGLKRASLNAQDGISLLQTAEGGLQNIQDMLQRMRELAVQAGNGTYTTNDRAEIQKEVDQLKEEINRISSSTEFNTKKLLNGDATALWSSDSTSLNAIIKSKVAEGNYNLEVSVSGGTNNVYKSDVMSSSNANLASIEGEASNIIDAAFTGDVKSAIVEISKPTADVNSSADVLGSYQADGGASTFDVTAATVGNTAKNSGWFIIEAADDGITVADATGTFNVTFVDAKTGAKTTAEVTGDLLGTSITFTADNLGKVATAAGLSDDLELTLAAGWEMNTGDKVALQVSGEIKENANSTKNGGGVVQLNDVNGDYTADGPTIAFGAGELTNTDGETEKSASVTHLTFNEVDGTYTTGSVTLTFDGNKAGTTATKGTVVTKAGESVSYITASITNPGSIVAAYGSTTDGKAIEGDVTVNVDGSATTAAATLVSATAGLYAADGTTVSSVSVAYTAAATTGNAGYYTFEALSDVRTSTGSSTTVSFKVNFVDAKTGEETSATLDATVVLAEEQIVFTAADFGNNGLGAVSQNLVFDLGGADAVLGQGSKLFIAQNGSAGAADASISYSGSATVGASVNATYTDAELAAGGTAEVYNVVFDEETGEVTKSGIELKFAEASLVTSESTITFTDKAYGGSDGTGIARLSTKLKDIDRFVSADGVNIFANNTTQELTLFGNGQSTTIYLEGDDTVREMEEKLTNAIITLGMGATADSSGTPDEVNENLVNYVTKATAESNEALAGTFVIQSARLGSDSKLSFIGDENLIKALSIVNIQEGENSEMTVNVTDAHTGKFIGSDKVNDYTLRGVIDGVDVEIDSNVGINMGWDDTSKTMSVSTTGQTQNLKLHLVDNAMEMQIGANEGQTILANIPQINTKSLGLDDVYMIDQELAQSSITKIDKALETVSGVRATIGAQINRLEYTMTGLDTTRENLTAAESRIRDLDIADEMAKFTKNQILMQSNIGMLAQANSLPQMALSLLG